MLSRFKGTRPALRSLALVAVLLFPAMFWPAPDAWLVPVAVVLGVVGLDLVWSWTLQLPELQRHVAPNIPVNRESTVRISASTFYKQ